MEEEGGSIEEEGASASDAEVEGASDLSPLAFLGALKVIVG